MTSEAIVRLWGNEIGAVALDPKTGIATFEYDRRFRHSGIEVSPLAMPLGPAHYSFPNLPLETFSGLPGLLSDSLPDRFGNQLIDAWLVSSGRERASLNAIERLCYTGERGMGALEYSPAMGPRVTTAHRIEIAALVDLASRILSDRERLSSSFSRPSRQRALADILRVGTSAGGARAKAAVAWNRETSEVRSGQISAGDGFEYWLVKFDGVKGNRDKELEDPLGYGKVEYAYHKMAIDCHIDMEECRLLPDGDRAHFMTRRFDRLAGGGKIHMQSLGALAHYDFNSPGAYSYEQAIQVIRELELGMDAVEQQFRRMVFNVVARNQDDHVKNIAFLMDQEGDWRLAPAFDVTYSYNPAGEFTASHQMTINGKRDDFALQDFRAVAQNASMKRGRAEKIVAEVRDVVARWRDYADDVDIEPAQRDRIQNVLRLQAFE